MFYNGLYWNLRRNLHTCEIMKGTAFLHIKKIISKHGPKLSVTCLFSKSDNCRSFASKTSTKQYLPSPVT